MGTKWCPCLITTVFFSVTHTVHMYTAECSCFNTELLEIMNSFVKWGMHDKATIRFGWNDLLLFIAAKRGGFSLGSILFTRWGSYSEPELLILLLLEIFIKMGFPLGNLDCVYKWNYLHDMKCITFTVFSPRSPWEIADKTTFVLERNKNSLCIDLQYYAMAMTM